ncbi:MAG: YggT family protein, partial [Firmicutes bacterium]|nr:YggT family protein [Bacillota bacterium]
SNTLVYFVDIAFEVYIIILFARVISSWFRVNPYGKFYQFIFSLTEPLLAPIRRLMPKGMGLDFSPMILMFILIFLQRMCLILVASLF